MPLIAPSATSAWPLAKARVRSPDGDHKVTSWPCCSTSAAVPKAIEPAPTIPTRIIIPFSAHEFGPLADRYFGRIAVLGVFGPTSPDATTRNAPAPTGPTLVSEWGTSAA